ncbi:MAG: asparagine synthase-related protein [Vulcanimicrobiota bacterium]
MGPWLGVADARFRSDLPVDASGVQHLLAAYLSKGAAECSRVAHDFCAVFWNTEERRLVAIRGPLGGRTLYYRSGDPLWLSNHIRRLRQLPGVGTEVDPLAVAAALVGGGLRTAEPSRTMFKDLRQLPPGHLLLFDGQQTRIQSYWSPADFRWHRPLRRGELPELESRFRDLFTCAVEDCLTQDTQVGFHLSGGLDSTSVACLAARQRPERKFPCFTYLPPEDCQAPAPPGRSYRDEPFIDAVLVQYPNLKIEYVRDPGDPLAAIDDQWHALTGEPARHLFGGWGEKIAARAVETGLTVLIGGRGGNLLFSSSGLPKTNWKKRLATSLGLRRGSAVRKADLALRPERARELELEKRLRAIDQSPRGRFLRIYLRGKVGALHNYWRGRFGLEELDPTTDLRMVEFCLQAPREFFAREGQKRRAVRDSLRGIVPDLVLDRSTVGMQDVGWQARLRGCAPALRGELERLTNSQLCNHFIDWDQVRPLFHHLPADDDFSAGAYHLALKVLVRTILVGRFLEWVEAGKA